VNICPCLRCRQQEQAVGGDAIVVDEDMPSAEVDDDEGQDNDTDETAMGDAAADEKVLAEPASAVISKPYVILVRFQHVDLLSHTDDGRNAEDHRQQNHVII